MGRSVNKVTLIGTLGRDPEVRYMPNGNAVANLTMATDESYNDKQTGQKVEQTEWHRLVVYGKLAEICQQYLKKGSKAYFEGKLKTREWEKDGIKRYTTEIVCNDMMMLDNRSGGGDSYNGGMNSGMGGGYQPPGGAAGMMNQPAQGGMNPGMGGQGYGQPSQPAPQQSYQPQGNNMGNQGGGYQQAPAQAPQQAPQQPSQPQGGYQQAPQQRPQQPAQPQGGYQQAPAQAPQQTPAPTPAPSNNFDDFDDDIPF